MSRLLLAVIALGLLPVFASADGPKLAVAPGEAKPARSEVQVQPATYHTPPSGQPVIPGYTYYGTHLQAQLWADWYNCSPDGCPTPIGCGNHWTEKRFIFGNCRQFFGTAEGTIGHGHKTTVRDNK